MESGLAAMNRVRQREVRTENKNRRGLFTSLGKTSKCEPCEGNLVGDDTHVEEDGPNAGGENLALE